MKLLHIFRFEFLYQAKTLSTWSYSMVLIASSFLLITSNYADDAREGYVLVNAPAIIGAVTVLSCVLWLLVGGSVAGHAATRDVQTRIHPLTYTSPVHKAEYLGGRFMAAFFINAIVMLAITAGMLLAVYASGLEPEIKGAFRISTYINAYILIALPNAFIATAIQFSIASLKRSAMASFAAGVLLFFLAYILGSALNQSTQSIGYGNLVDPMSFSIMINKLTVELTPVQINSEIIQLRGPLLYNRLFWFGISALALLYAYLKFQFSYSAKNKVSSKGAKSKQTSNHSSTESSNEVITKTTPVIIPKVSQRFGFETHAGQTITIAIVSFGQLLKSRAGILILTIMASLVVVIVPLKMEYLNVPMIPRTNYLMTFLTAPLTNAQTPWIIIPLLIMFYAGELIWREREVGISEIYGATPAPEWVLLTGKFLGLLFILLLWLSLLMLAGICTQLRLGYDNLEISQYMQTLFGIQLTDYILFAVLAVSIQVIVNQKYLAHLVVLIAYGYITFAPTLGIDNKLLIYGADTGLSYSDMNGFGPSLWPWLWYKVYWLAWALLLVLITKLFWARSKETAFASRLKLAYARFNGITTGTIFASTLVILFAGGFILYNNHVLNDHHSASEKMNNSASYEKRFGSFEYRPQPTTVATRLYVDLFPADSRATIRGTYHLVNNTTSPVDSILVSTADGTSTEAIAFDRNAKVLTQSKENIDRIYILANPLQPGDSIKIDFKVNYSPAGFTNDGVASYVVANGTYFTNRDMLPFIGFQPYRCIADVSVRKKLGLPPRPLIPSLYDVKSRYNLFAADQTVFEAIVSTDDAQTAVAPGMLHRTWTANGRRYFHYITNAPIPNQYAFFSARYATKNENWNNVSIQVFHQPGHTTNLSSILTGARSALDYYTKKFGPYPYDVFRLIEHPGHGFGMHAEATTIDFQEGFSLLKPDDENAYDLPFYIVSHEAAHQWWGAAQVLPARVEGAMLLTETLAVYTAMQVLEEEYGNEQLQRYLAEIRKAYEVPRSKANVPLLRAHDQYLGYRKGPFALYALSKYIGRKEVNAALQQLLKKFGRANPPLPTSLDLYEELKMITPDTLQYLLHDLFEENTFWDLETHDVTARKTSSNSWDVTLDIETRKSVTDELGNERNLPMNDWIEIGVFGAPEKENESNKIIYLHKHRIRTGRQNIKVTVPYEPIRAGIDPNNLLIDLRSHNNTKVVRVKK